VSNPATGKSRIVHLALKVIDLERATRFYEEVFGFRQTGTGYARGHVSRHMTDGAFDLALMVYDNEDVHEAQISGAGPCIHHFGIEVPDRDAAMSDIVAHGGEIISDPKEGALKFRPPNGVVAEIVRAGRYRKAVTGDGARIAGLAITTRDKREASDFYSAVFGFHATPDGHLTDGAFSVTLLGGAKSGPAVHHHWTIQVNNVARIGDAIEQHDGAALSQGPDLLYRTVDGSLLKIVAG
jgi:lactoylglutathione lyase